MNREQRKARDEDFRKRERPKILWDSESLGTAIRTANGYRAKPAVAKVKYRPTEAEDNAEGRAIRRKQHWRDRGWLPYAKR